MRILAVDVGGSGAKHAWVEADRDGVRLVSPVVSLERPEWGRFEPWLASRIRERPDCLAVSCMGLVDPDSGVNRVASVAGWRNRPLRANLEAAFAPARVVVLNDVEAHLFAHLGDHPTPLLAMAMGTSVGLAVADESRRVVRTRGGMPLEFGALRLDTSATCKELWSALGSIGLEELQRKLGPHEGTVRFGHRAGALLAQYAGLFSVRTVVLSGGIVESTWRTMGPAVAAEFSRGLPHWLTESPPRLLASPHGRAAALVGVAAHARQVMRGGSPAPGR
ncbi:MAG: hypothetical protein M5U13_15590 [Thermoanaerobaculia bacterium]|nr:hypothetical protein [Thermoanaerobaculia bacterium]